jgi:hypothetical protein
VPKCQPHKKLGRPLVLVPSRALSHTR